MLVIYLNALHLASLISSFDLSKRARQSRRGKILTKSTTLVENAERSFLDISVVDSTPRIILIIERLFDN